MRKYLWAVGTLLFLLSAAEIAQADLIGDLTVQVTGTDCDGTCDYLSWDNTDWWFHGGNNPYPVTATGDFTANNPPWKYSYTSANPDTWDGECHGLVCDYNAIYGQGGTITIQGPYDLVFTGVLTAGTYHGSQVNIINYHTGEEDAQFSFTGKWSNGLSGSGSVENDFTDTIDYKQNTSSYSNTAKLDLVTVPEPASLLLLGSSIAAFWRKRR